MRGRMGFAPDSNLGSVAVGGTYDDEEKAARLPVAKMARRKRVVLLAPSAAQLATSSGLIEAMSHRGHGVTCCAPKFDDRNIKMFRRLGAEPRSLDLPALSLSPISFGRAARRLKEIFELSTPDLVVAYASEEGPMAPMAAALAKAPNIATVVCGVSQTFAHSSGLQHWAEWPKRKALASLYGYALRRSDAVVFLCSDDEKLFKSLGLLPKGLISVSVNGGGADFNSLDESPLPPLDKGVIFLMAADLDDAHGVRDFCEAARLLKAKTRNVRCVLVGGLPTAGKAVPLKELRRFRGAVQYIGPREDLRPYVERCHVFVAPSRGGGATPGLLAALTTGRPIIVTATRGCRDAVAEGVNGVIVPPRDPEGLAKAMVQLLHRPDLLPAMARASRNHARHHFDSIGINEIMLDTFGL